MGNVKGYSKFNNNKKSLITRSYLSDLLINFWGLFKIYRTYLFSNISLTIFLLFIPMFLAFINYALIPWVFVITLPFFSLFFLSFIFLPLIIMDFRNSTIIKRIGATDITRYNFIIYLTIINVIISFIFFFFFLFVLFPIFNFLYNSTIPLLVAPNSAAKKSWEMWANIDYIRIILLVIIFSILGSQFGILLGMTFGNKSLVLLTGLFVSAVFMFMSGLSFSAWVPKILAKSDHYSFANWIYALTPFTFVGNAAIGSIFGYTGWWFSLNALFVGTAFSLFIIITSKWWFSFSSIR